MRQQRYTLFELLLSVMLLIAVLLVALPPIAHSLQRKRVKCVSSIRALNVVLANYQANQPVLIPAAQTPDNSWMNRLYKDASPRMPRQ